MKTLKPFISAFLIVFSLLFSSVLSAQERGKQTVFEPEVGQEGKDVVWVPTPQPLVDKMLELARITKDDYLVDLGSGDGRTVITAAKRGTRALGVEYNPDMVALSRKNAETAGVSDMAKFVEGDIFEFDFSEATVITMFLLPDINLRLRPQILDMKPGTRVVTNTFTMQEWQWDEMGNSEDEENTWTSAYLWIVPAKVEGKWRLQGENEIVFRQEFQMLSGDIHVKNKKPIPLAGGKLSGNDITFTAGDAVYTGKVEGNIMKGTCSEAGKTFEWIAVRLF